MDLQLGDTALVSPGLFESLNLEGSEMKKLRHRLPPNTMKIEVPSMGRGPLQFSEGPGYHILSRERLGDDEVRSSLQVGAFPL